MNQLKNTPGHHKSHDRLLRRWCLAYVRTYQAHWQHSRQNQLARSRRTCFGGPKKNASAKGGWLTPPQWQQHPRGNSREAHQKTRYQSKKDRPKSFGVLFLKGRNTLRLRPGADASRHPQSCPSRAPGSSRPRSQRIPPRTPCAGWRKKKANKATQKWWFLGHPNGNLVFLVVSRNSKGWC